MESLLNRVGGSENEHVMGRLEWLNHLSLIFNLTANLPMISPCSIPVTTEAFLNTLIDNFSRLPLRPYSEYKKVSSVKCISFKDVFIMFENDFGRILNWDHIMEKVMSFEINHNKHKRGGSDSPGSIDLNELVFISKLSSTSVDYEYESEHRSQRLGDLRIPHTPPNIENNSFIAISGNFTPSPRDSQDFSNKASLRMPELGENLISLVMKQSENSAKLNLSCKKLVFLTQQLPNTLVQLDLSHNNIERLPNLEYLEKLDYLNLSWNCIQSLGGCKGVKSLKEIYLSHNKISEIDEIELFQNLVIVDLAFNQIKSFNAVANVGKVMDLKVLDLEGNTITKTSGWKEKILGIAPWVCEFSCSGVLKYSKYPQSSVSKLKKKVQGVIKKSHSGKMKNK